MPCIRYELKACLSSIECIRCVLKDDLSRIEVAR